MLWTGCACHSFEIMEKFKACRACFKGLRKHMPDCGFTRQHIRFLGNHWNGQLGLYLKLARGEADDVDKAAAHLSRKQKRTETRPGCRRKFPKMTLQMTTLQGIYVSRPKSEFFRAPCEDPNSRSTLGFSNLHHKGIRIQNWGFYLLDPPRGLGC